MNNNNLFQNSLFNLAPLSKINNNQIINNNNQIINNIVNANVNNMINNQINKIGINNLYQYINNINKMAFSYNIVS